MYRRDILGKSRIYWSLISIKEIIEKKKKIDPNDRFSIIIFSDVNYELENYVYNFSGIKEYIEEYAEIIGKTQLPIDKAVKSIIIEKRKIGQKIFRIIILSDGYIHPKITNPIKFAKVAKDLGIICDTLRYGKGTITGNILKRIVEITGGNYYYVNSEDEYFDVIQKVAEKKKIKVTSFLDRSKDDSLDEMSKDIASNLLKIDDLTEEQRAQVNFEELKCAICHSQQCMLCETGFYGCGRFCPSCLRPIHLHCALKWAEQQNSNSQTEHKVLRCPFCYYLLKIPITIQKEKFKLADSVDINVVNKISFSDEISELMTSICAHPECGIMFDDSLDTFVYKCNACGSYFHLDCFMKDYSQNGKCPYCNCESVCNDR